MQKRLQIKNHRQEIRFMAKRVLMGLLIMILLVMVLLGRLVYLQIDKQNMYTTLSRQNWLDLVPIEPVRGLIYDRNGILLVENTPVFSLDVIPSRTGNVKNTLIRISKIIELSQDEINFFKKQLYEHRPFDEIPLKLRMTDQEVALFSENQYQFPGVFIKARLMRHYLYGESLSHVLGYVGRITAQDLNEIDPENYTGATYLGKLGIEKFYEDELRGKVGYEEVESDATGQPLRVLRRTQSLPGNNLTLTIDIHLQLAVEQALGDDQGSAIVIDPKTGQILAMVSNPGFDPNLFVTGINQKDYDALSHSPTQPLFNRGLQGLYPIASTIKPFFALLALNEGVISPTDAIKDPGWFNLGNHRFHDDSRYGHGNVDLTKALTVSCDTFFYQLAPKLGIGRMDTMLNAFGFGQLTGIDLDGELAGNVASPEWKKMTTHTPWYMGDTVNASIGQGFFRATPLQMASAVSALANRGARYAPYLLLGEALPNNPFTYEQPIALERIPITDNYIWQTVINAMQNVVASPVGTGHGFGTHLPYTIAAKTGTAQVVKRFNPNHADNEKDIAEKFRDHHWFIAFAPVDQPQIAVVVLTEHSNDAITTARKIFDYYFADKNRKLMNVSQNNQASTQKK